MKYLIILIGFAFLYSCKTREKQTFEYLPLDTFKNDTSLIAPGTKVNILAFSGSIDNNNDAIYYSQILVVNETTNDTLSILCPSLRIPHPEGDSNGIFILPTEYDPNKNIREALYKRVDSSTISLLRIISDIENSSMKETTEDLNNVIERTASKKELVAVNKTIPIFSRNYKTVIGILSFDSNVGYQ